MSMYVQRNLFIFITFFSFFANVGHCIIVKTTNGLIDGDIAYTYPKHSLYYAFRSIPYAKPPIGALRFQPPQQLDNWEGILRTKDDSPRCIQTNKKVIVGQEDCLYLNVYTTQMPSDTEQLLPVMVWVYGGGFIAGTSEYQDAAPDYFLDEGIVFISINYRLGILGFLSLNDLVAPGNNGLKDQNMALRWIKANIRSFGGDPDRITLFGQSAGSSSVSYHIQSDMSAGLFSGAILESGTSLCLWSFSRGGPQTAIQVAASFNIDINDSQSIVNGLREVEAKELHKRAMDIQSTALVVNNPRDGLIYAPVIEPKHEGAFFTERSYELLKKGKFARVPIMIGYNSMEATFSFPDAFRLFLLKYDLNPSNLVPFDMNIGTSVVKDAVGKEIKFRYFGLLPIALSNANVIEFLSDDQFVRPIQQFALLLSEFTKTYLYEFHYEGGLGGIVNRTFPGVAHSEELGYLFRRNISANELDHYMSKRMVKLWTNFAKFRNPTPEPDDLFQNQIWLPISPTSKDMDYFRIDVDLKSSVNPKRNNIDFWTHLYQRYGEPPYDTY
ncbi:juvenile hormone esterase-like [Coccinella septempunctata]|uniref:juvenile hormone esterase-like n=1 Tax=Coccinella septempunctata TaxID=41139 RepID=UPI001D081BDA|nr:juvenile hormone esterase-like [Coccinella septempunctata]